MTITSNTPAYPADISARRATPSGIILRLAVASVLAAGYAAVSSTGAPGDGATRVDRHAEAEGGTGVGRLAEAEGGTGVGKLAEAEGGTGVGKLAQAEGGTGVGKLA